MRLREPQIIQFLLLWWLCGSLLDYVLLCPPNSNTIFLHCSTTRVPSPACKCGSNSFHGMKRPRSRINLANRRSRHHKLSTRKGSARIDRPASTSKATVNNGIMTGANSHSHQAVGVSSPPERTNGIRMCLSSPNTRVTGRSGW